YVLLLLVTNLLEKTYIQSSHHTHKRQYLPQIKFLVYTRGQWLINEIAIPLQEFFAYVHAKLPPLQMSSLLHWIQVHTSPLKRHLVHFVLIKRMAQCLSSVLVNNVASLPLLDG